MFQLYDQTRRRVCVASFLALGVLPALLVGGWCIARHFPGRVEAEARELSWRLGATVRLHNAKHLRPGTTLYEGLEIADPETGQVLLRCAELKIAAAGSSKSRGNRPQLAMVASRPEVDAAALGRLWQLLQRVLEGDAGRIDANCRLAASSLTLRAAAAQTLTDVEGCLETSPAGTSAQLEFRLAGSAAPQSLRIRAVRDRHTSSPSTGLELDTNGGQIPCGVLALALTECKQLGPQCSFRGSVWAKDTREGWEGEIAGQLAGLDLDRLVTDCFPHRLSGAGNLAIQSLRFRRGRIEQASVMLSAGPGTIDRSLIDAAVERCRLTATTELAHAPQHVPYEQLAFLLTLDGEGATVQGCCRPGEPGTVLLGAQGRMLGEPHRQPQPIVALVQTLVPQNELQVPASRQTDWLLRHLPVAQVVPPAGSDAVPPHVTIRLGDTQTQ